MGEVRKFPAKPKYGLMVNRVCAVLQTRGLDADEEDARAVIDAMREETEEIMAAGLGGIWPVVIDAILDVREDGIARRD